MRQSSTLLDHTRWLAALLVAGGHLRNFIMVDWNAVIHRGAITGAFYWATGLGRIAVIVFFVVSGYLVGGRALTAIETGRFDTSSYVLNRLSRLYPPLVAAIALAVLFDGLGLLYCNGFGYYDHPNSYQVAGELYSVRDALNARTALLNLMFLQTVFAPTFGSDSPLWSLANEFWYYIAGPLVGLCIFGSARSRLAPLAVLGALLLTSFFLNVALAALFLTWLAGAMAYRQAKPMPVAVTICCGAVFGGVAAAVRSMHWFPAHQYLADLAVAASFSLLLWSSGQPGGTSARENLGSRLAGFSYSLYLVHVPLAFLLAAAALQWLHTPVRLQPGPLAFTIYFISLTCAIGLAYGVSRLTEARTDEIRAWLAGKIKWLALPGSSLP